LLICYLLVIDLLVLLVVLRATTLFLSAGSCTKTTWLYQTSSFSCWCYLSAWMVHLTSHHWYSECLLDLPWSLHGWTSLIWSSSSPWKKLYNVSQKKWEFIGIQHPMLLEAGQHSRSQFQINSNHNMLVHLVSPKQHHLRHAYHITLNNDRSMLVSGFKR
jgi:hypothetical protein